MSIEKKIKEKITASKAWQKLVARSHTKTLPGFRNVSPFNIVKRLNEHVIWDDLIERASAISYNTAMALPPLLLFLCTLIPIIANSQFIVRLQLMDQLTVLIKDVIPARSNHEPILAFIDTIVSKPRNTLLLDRKSVV